MITLWRRHAASCPHADKGRNYIKCNCPIWADGYINGKRQFRKTLDTRDMTRARNKAAALESEDKIYKTLPEAITAFKAHCAGLGSETKRKYANVLNQLQKFCDVDSVREITIDVLDAYRAQRNLARITALKELELLRQFCSFCKDRNWMDDNPAKKIKGPKNLKPNDVEPYSPAEVAAIIDATAQIGQTDYERRRALAMVLTLRYTALRIGDMSMLARTRITGNRIFLHAEKNGKPIFLPVPQEMKTALDNLPIPKGTVGESKYFFWNGTSKPRSMKKSADDTLRAVFKKSGVLRAHAHRFRHTLATEMLENDATFEEIADVLGDSVKIVIEHYAKFTPRRQQRIDDLMSRVHSSAHYQPKLVRVK